MLILHLTPDDLFDWLDGSRHKPLQAQHVADCATCRARLSDARLLRTLLRRHARSAREPLEVLSNEFRAPLAKSLDENTLAAYQDGTLSPYEMEQMDERLLEDDEALEALLELRAVLGEPPPALPPRLVRNAHEALFAASRRGRPDLGQPPDFLGTLIRVLGGKLPAVYFRRSDSFGEQAMLRSLKSFPKKPIEDMTWGSPKIPHAARARLRNSEYSAVQADTDSLGADITTRTGPYEMRVRATASSDGLPMLEVFLFHGSEFRPAAGVNVRLQSPDGDTTEQITGADGVAAFPFPDEPGQLIVESTAGAWVFEIE